MEWVRGSISANGLAVLTLDRPKALNAMNLEMDLVFKNFLEEWSRNDAVKAVLVESSSPRAFSAGMDVKGIAAALQEDRNAPVLKQALAAEYTLICAIARYRKPYISLMNGITMGFGIGLSGHGRYRVVTEKTVLAMPESGIGFFPDVGFAHIAARMPADGAFGYYLGLSGSRVSNPADALFLGLGSHFVPSAELSALKNALLAKDLSNASEAVEAALSEFGRDPGPSQLEKLLPKVSTVFGHKKPVGKSIEDLVKAQQSADTQVSEWASGALAGIGKAAPFSLAVTHKFIAAAGISEWKLEEVMKFEFRVAGRLATRSDFTEGVRAVLVDKDQNPRWQPSRLEDVDKEEVESMFDKIDNDFPV